MIYANSEFSKVLFAIVFNIDISGSMAGRRFNLVKKSVRKFLAECPNDDFVAAICFNSTPRLLRLRRKTSSRFTLSFEQAPKQEEQYIHVEAHEAGKKEGQCCCRCALF
jgi:Mg-chelatase subunit ChlD